MVLIMMTTFKYNTTTLSTRSFNRHMQLSTYFSLISCVQYLSSSSNFVQILPPPPPTVPFCTSMMSLKEETSSMHTLQKTSHLMYVSLPLPCCAPELGLAFTHIDPCLNCATTAWSRFTYIAVKNALWITYSGEGLRTRPSIAVKHFSYDWRKKYIWHSLL